jgi:hypothetical protein
LVVEFQRVDSLLPGKSPTKAMPSIYDAKLCRKSYLLMRDFFAETQ